MKKNYVPLIISTVLLSLIISCSNSNENSDKNQEQNTELTDSLAQQITTEEMNRGKLIYINNCQTCHQKDGKGVEGAFPSLIDTQVKLKSIVNGVEGTTMVAFKDELNDNEIVDVVNFVNNSWNN